MRQGYLFLGTLVLGCPCEEKVFFFRNLDHIYSRKQSEDKLICCKIDELQPKAMVPTIVCHKKNISIRVKKWPLEWDRKLSLSFAIHIVIRKD